MNCKSCRWATLVFRFLIFQDASWRYSPHSPLLPTHTVPHIAGSGKVEACSVDPTIMSYDDTACRC